MYYKRQISNYINLRPPPCLDNLVWFIIVVHDLVKHIYNVMWQSTLLYLELSLQLQVM